MIVSANRQLAEARRVTMAPPCFKVLLIALDGLGFAVQAAMTCRCGRLTRSDARRGGAQTDHPLRHQAAYVQSEVLTLHEPGQAHGVTVSLPYTLA